jgi:very-short-patch-repair endonuclease
MKGQTSEKILKPKLQRRLRKNPTDAEQRLWTCLRRKQMGQFRFRRQHPFGDYVIDFVCLEAMLAVEVDGGQHTENRHGWHCRSGVPHPSLPLEGEGAR